MSDLRMPPTRIERGGAFTRSSGRVRRVRRERADGPRSRGRPGMAAARAMPAGAGPLYAIARFERRSPVRRTRTWARGVRPSCPVSGRQSRRPIPGPLAGPDAAARAVRRGGRAAGGAVRSQGGAGRRGAADPGPLRAGVRTRRRDRRKHVVPCPWVAGGRRMALPPPMAEPALCRQSPEVGAGCSACVHRPLRRCGSDPPGSPASISRPPVHREWPVRPAGAGFGDTPSGTSPGKTSGSDPSQRTGGELSTGMHLGSAVRLSGKVEPPHPSSSSSELVSAGTRGFPSTYCSSSIP